MRETKAEQVVKRDVLVAVVCDRCGKRRESETLYGTNWAELSDQSWNTKSCDGLGVSESYDGQYESDGVDLCFDCASEIIEKIRNKQL